MTSFEEKNNFAVKELENAGIRKSNYNPPLIRLLHKLDMQIRPPHYNSFLNNMLLMGCFFGVFWGALMYFGVWRNQNNSSAAILSGVFFAGLFFGISMAAYYKYSAYKNKLTPWQDIQKI